MSRYVEKAGLDCLEIILKKCFCKNDDWLRNLTTVFEFCEVITTDKSKEVDELLKSGCPNEVAVELIIHSLQERKVDKRCIANACNHAEFPGGLIVSKAVFYFGTAAFVSDSLRWLVTAWNELCAHEVQVKTVIAENWETTARLEEHSSNWPLQFIMNCTSHKESENMIAKIKELLEQIALGEFEHIQKSELQGAEIPKEKDILRPLIERIFQQFFISQEDKIAEVLQLFTHFHLLSTENLSNALREAEKGKFSATNLMHLIVINSPNDWSEKMSTACQSKEFPGDKAFASIILALLTSDIIRDEIQWLIAVRDGLEQSQMLIDRIIPRSWKEQHDITLPGKFWPEHLIEICITSENLPEINNFLEKVKEILEKEPSAAEDSIVLDIGVQEDDESFFSFQSVDVTQEKNFLYESFDVISELFDEMKPFVESKWPDNEDLIDKKTWPSTVLMKCDTEDSETVHSLVMKFREVVEKKEEDKDKLQTEKLYEESMQWLHQFSKILKPNVNVIKPLAQTCWPNDAGVTRILPMTLINKCNQESDKVKVTNFIDQLKQVLETKKSEKTVDESIKEKSSISQQTDENIDSKNQKPIVASSYKATAHDATIKALITKPFQEKTQETEEEKRGFEKSDLHVIVIEQILAQYFLSEKVSVMELLTVFHRSNLLTEENLLTAQRNTEQSRFSAPQLMNLILSNCPKDWKEKMVVACQNKDFEGDVFASILQNLLKRDVIDSDIIWFISVWNEVQKCNSVLEGIIADSWKDEHGILTEYESWPLYLYKKCILEEEEMKVKKFLHHMKEVLQNRLIEGPETLSAMASPPDKIKDIPEHSQTLQQRKDLEDILEESKNWIAEQRLEPSELEHAKHISKGVKGSVHGKRKLHPKSNNSEGPSVDEHQVPPKKKEDGIDQSTDFKDHRSALQWLHNQEHKDLKEYDDYTKTIVANFWPQKDEIVKDEHWPQALIKACQKSDEDTVNLINKIKDYFELIKVSSAETVSENYQNLKEDEYVLEFRMICQNARKCSICFSNENWKGCNMKFDVEKKFYYFQVIVKKDYYLEYKYFMHPEGWECLENNSNRVLHVTPDLCSSKKKVTLFDVVSFGKMDFGQVVEYLPSRSTLCHQGVDLTSITDDIYAWVFQMIRGWEIVSSHSERIVSADLDSQTVINNWLKQEFLQVCQSENISCIICTLALCNALCHSKYSFGKPLLKTLLKVLCTEKLSEEMLQKLYNEIFQHFINNDFRSAEYPNIPHTITSLLYEACVSGVAEFILILPLYQLIVNDGKVVRKIPRTDDTDWHLAVSCLPPIRNVQWKNVRSRLQDSEILDLLPQIKKLSGLHPWIVKSYQYMLSHQKIMQLTEDKSPICIHFNLEVILESFLSDTFQRFIRSASNIEELFDNMLHSDVNELEELDIEHILELIYKLLKQSNDDMQAPTANAAVIHCLNICSKALSSLMETTDSDLNSCLEILGDILKCIYRSVSESDLSIGQIKHWDALLQIKWSDKKISDEWIKELCECIKKRVYEFWLKDDEGYWDHYDSLSGFEFDKRLENIFEARAEESLDNLLNKNKWMQYFDRFRSIGKLIGIGNKKNKVFNKLVHKQLSSYNDKAELALKWPHLVKVLELFKNQSQVFTSENKGTLKGVITALGKIFADLISGDIVVERFNLIYEYGSRISELLQYSEVHSGVNVEEVISFRKVQLDAVYKAKKNLEIFKDRCSELGKENVIVDVKELDDIFSTKIKEKKMSQLVKCSEDLQDKDITVMLYGKDIKKMDEIEKIGMLHGNIFFKHYWSVMATTWEGGKGTEETATSWEKVLNQLWNSVSAKLISFTKRFDDGSMCISELPQKLTEFSDKEIETHFQELYAFYDKCHRKSALHKKERISDVKKLRKLKRSQAVIDALASIKDVLALQGKFSSLEMFRKKDIAKMTLLQFSQLDYSSVVPNFSQHDLGVLVSFSEQKDLIDWLKKNIKGEKEVQPFYELATSKIGDTPMEFDKVSSMYSAVIGYSPLLFELDKVIDVESLILRCKQILKNCQKDENLCEKWNSIGACVDWIEEIRMLLGSDHVQAMSLAQKINENGIYVITCKNEKNISTEECLELQMQESGEKKTYKLADLRDLQSKLMLIAGEKEARKHVVTYVDLLAAVESLDQVFVDLVSAGCMLFQNWRMEIASSIESEFKFTMIFEEGSHPITGKGNLATIETILSTMKKSLDRWTKQMNKYRTNHYYLNEYNIQQITYLCRQLAKNQLISVPDQVTMLLARVKKNTTLAEITEALNEATSCSDDSDDEAENNSENNEENQKVRKMTQILRSILKKHSCSLEVAKAAVFATNYQDLDSCTDWIVINRNNKRLIDKNSEKFDLEIEFTHQSVSDFTIATVLHDRSAQSLKEVMNKLQQQEASKDNQALSSSLLTVYEKYISSTADKTLQDFLSVKHLGKFLSNLSKMRMKVPIAKEALLKREMKQPLRKGKPNLIICPENVILHQVLSLYMNSRDQPLPSTSEVLICSEKTNQDDIERFFRRAMCDCVERRAALFCLAFAHELSYNVSQAAEKIFTSLSQSEISSDLNRDYQLVIFTTKQHHYLTTCFDQYHTDVKLNEENEKVTNYLAPHLKVDIRELTKTAACIEENFHFVKVVYSHRSGVGKTLHVRRLKEGLQSKMASHNNTSWHTTTIRFMEKTLDTDHVIDMLNPTDKDVLNADTHLIHLDFTPAVQDGVEQFAFNLLILGSIEDSQGRIWQRHQNHMYAVEITEFQGTELKNIWSNHIFEYLPKVCCLSPREVVDKLSLSASIGMDKLELLSDVIQRPIQYLDRLRQNKPLDNFKYKKENENQKIIDQEKCVTILLKYCTMKNPSWAQLLHFSSFLNAQLENCEKSTFFVVPELRGLKSFAVNFMIQMAQDFATPSLSSADQSTQDIATPSLSSADQSTQDISGKRAERVYDEHQLRRTWEESSHPYIFFNDDCDSMTFINVNLTREGHLVDKNKKVISEKVISPKLMNSLKAQGVPLGVDFDSLNRGQKLMEICKVMGIEIYPEEKLDTGNLGMTYITVEVEVAVPGQSRDKFYKMKVPDPDPTYELTTDNVLKILAIYMRFKCQIPVIIMGETGCGKTRMVEFISKLKAQIPAVKTGEGKVKNMITLKVHGGITVKDVHQSIERAKEIAQDNVQKYGLNTILFFDEANTTESIYAIKEAVCDLEVNGKSFRDSELQIVAACNPYKKLSEKAIENLENSGLGYRVKKEDTKDKLGSIPMRTLVYRVVALPPSMQPLVWDFGQLADDTEKIYIGQMIKKLGIKLELTSGNRELLSDMLSDVQCYMREQKDETRYVSLRDVERCMIVYQWFWKNKEWLYPEIKKLHKKECRCCDISDEIRTLIQVLGVCYHTSLDSREEFRKELTHRLNIRSSGIHRYEQLEIEKEIVACQKALVKDMKIEKDIALNEALVENVFMIAICADMKIPLFLVGKPGSSKSLAKTIVSDNMQGPNSTSKMFKHLKQVQVVSFQCSALTRATGIERVFNQCVQLQTKQDEKTVVLVLDEIGLAEDSSNMPLKVLHPLLERGSTKSESLINTDPNQKVGFVGISNWSLDPAKMNRGLFVTRKRPTEEDLQITTEGIFSGESEEALSQHRQVIKALTLTYLTIYKKQEREYFGLRDFYSLMKMVRLLCMKDLTFQDIMTAVVRNFSGGKTSYTEEFKTALKDTKKFEDTEDGVNSVQDIIEKNLIGRTESRYLLLLTNQYSAVNLLYILGKGQKENIQIIFGSSFPGDKNYTEICRNINRIKICMEAGSPVVILNLAEINESLYEMLNQHYVTFGGEKYVELGLGYNRVKCKVHEKFRMIIIEKKEVVYEEYPIPLLNRLEKHHFDSHSLLIHRQRNSAHDLQEWVTNFTSFKSQKPEFDGNAAFPGYNDDTVSSVILMCDAKGNKDDKEVYQNTLLQSASMDSVFRLQKSNIISTEVTRMQQCYFQTQSHDSLIQLMKKAIKLQQKSIPIYEVTTYSNILSENDRTEVEKQLCLNKNSVMLLSLQQFETEQQFLRKLDDFFKKCQKVPDDSSVLLIQCFQAHLCWKLISCARYCLTNKFTEFLERNKKREQRVVIAFLLSTDRQIGSVGNEALVLQHTKDGEIVFIDELRPTMKLIGPASCFFNLSLQEVFEKSLTYLSPNGKPEEFLDIVSLLKESVSEAVNMLQFENREENLTGLISMLMELFEDKDFSRAIVQKISALLLTKEAQDVKWIIEEAFSHEHLLEGGTFRKTIWFFLKQQVTLYLAYITSIVYANGNLEHIKKHSAQWIRKMWLKIFHEYRIPFIKMRNEKEMRKEKESFKVSCSLIHSSYRFKVPFISMIFKELSNNWTATHTQKGFQEKEKLISIFLKTVRNSPMYSVMKEAYSAGGDRMKDAFVSDVVRLVYQYDPKPEHEVKAVDQIVNSFVKSKYDSTKDQECFKDGDEFAIVFHTIKLLENYLETLSDIFKICPELVNQTGEWIKKSNEQHSADFEIHEYAFSDLMAFISERSGKISDEKICQDWIELAKKVKRILRDHFKSAENKAEDVVNWRQMSFLYYFLTSILPSMSDEVIQTNYTKVIAEQVNLLSKGCKKRNLQSKEYVLLVCGTLGLCYDEIKMKLLFSWQDSFCKVCLNKLENAVVLPCKHFLCVNCADKTCKSEGSICPTCAERIPIDYKPIRPVHSEESLAQLQELKSNCTSFFLRYLCKFIFQQRGFSDSDKEVPDFLIKELLMTADGNQDLDLSAIDLNVNFRSCVLKELINGGGKARELDSYISEGAFDLIVVALRHFESQLLDNETIDVHSGKWDNDVMKQKFDTLCRKEKLCLDLIETAAEIRLGIQTMSCFVHAVLNNSDEWNFRITDKIKSVIDFLNSDKTDTLKLFFIKCGCVQFGTEWFTRILESKRCEKLVPRYLKGERNSTIDYWMLLGTDFAAEKAKLCAVLPEQRMKVFSCLETITFDENLIKAFGALSWISSIQNPNPEIKFLRSLATSKISLQNYFASVYDVLSSQRVMKSQQKSILLQLLSMVAVAVSLKKHLVKEFFKVLVDPKSLMSMFLPAMPESLYYSIPEDYRAVKKNVLNELWSDLYTCPNGHFYTIGDCTHPVTLGKCKCGEVIGGKNYKPAPGNKRFKLDEKTQVGYMLEDVNPPRQNMDKPEDRMSKQGVAVTQAILHSCMILALQQDKRLVSSFSKLPDMDSDKFMNFVINKLMKNLQDLSSALSKNMDETLIIMHKILLHIIRVQLPADLPKEQCDWSSAESRKAWEQQFRKLYLLPVFKNLDQEIIDGWSLLNEGKKLGNEKLYRLTHDFNLEKPAISKVWCNDTLWKMILHPTSAQLLQTIQDKHTVQSVIIQTILDTPQLGLICHLKNVLELQKYLTEKYQYKLDMDKADDLTFENCSKDINEEDEKKKVDGLIHNYLITLKQVFPALRAKRQRDPDFNICFNRNCSISLALPSKKGRGQFAKMLVEHLIDIQNTFLSKCEEKLGLKLDEVSVADLNETHLVCIDKHKDLLPLIKFHTSYHITSDENGSHHHISYNTSALEKGLREKYVLYKKHIKKSSIPCIQYSQDVGIGADWEKLRETITQEPLNQKQVMNIDMVVGNSRPAELYEGVRSLAHAISFLTKVSSDPEKILVKYLEEDMMLSPDRFSVVSKNVKIKHILALYLRLSWHKAKQFTSQGLNPYKEYLQEGQEEIPTELKNELEVAFRETRVSLLQQRLNEILLKKPDFKPNWSLLEHIFPYLDDYIDLNTEDNSWYKSLPKSLCFKHIADLFKLSEKFLRENQ